MARSLLQLKVFVSATSDTTAEKAARVKVLTEVSRQLEKTHSIALRMLVWPDDIRPGVNVDVQSEINQQVGVDYDIYIGLLRTSVRNAHTKIRLGNGGRI